MTIDQMISAIQQAVGVRVDGRAGPETWSAIYTRLVKPPIASGDPSNTIQTVDPRSEKSIATLLPQVRPMARALVQKAAVHGIQIKIISGLRTYAEQDLLYAQGRTLPGGIVTQAKGGYSNHNFGIAFDVGVFEGTKYLPESDKYTAVGALGLDLGLEWGGNWKSLVDRPHFQVRPEWALGLTERAMLVELRRRTANDLAIFDDA